MYTGATSFEKWEVGSETWEGKNGGPVRQVMGVLLDTETARKI